MIEQLAKFFSNLNRNGIPIPLARDPKTNKGSLTFTMAVVSFGCCILLLAGKITNLIGDVDYDNALWLLGMTLSAYLGRQYQKSGKDISIGATVSANEKTDGSTDAGTSK